MTEYTESRLAGFELLPNDRNELRLGELGLPGEAAESAKANGFGVKGWGMVPDWRWYCTVSSRVLGGRARTLSGRMTEESIRSLEKPVCVVL
jgi:hypothetical protein